MPQTASIDFRNTAQTGPVSSPKVHLAFLDGIRGLAALYIAGFHAAGDVPPPAHSLRALAWLLQFGHYAVGIFIVLSGYCLMLPVALSAEGALPGGFWAYLQRRMRRILPAYYVVLALAWVSIAALHGRHPGLSGGEAAAVLQATPGALLSHLFIVHNLHPSWAQALDPPMWSVAMEWQIYLMFPLVLLPIWRRIGAAAALCSGVALGMAPHLLLPARFNLDWTFPWYLSLFAMGMAGASLTFSARSTEIFWRKRLPWSRLGLAFLAAFALLVGRYPDLPEGRMWLPDMLLGIATLCLLVAGALATAETNGLPARQDIRHPAALPLRLLTARPSLWLGTLSYSLYLVHAPALWTLFPLISALHLSENTAFLVRLSLGLPLALACAAVLFFLVERPFQSRSHRAIRPEARPT